MQTTKKGRKERYLVGGRTYRIGIKANMIPHLYLLNSSHQTFFIRQEAQSGLDVPGKAGVPGGVSSPASLPLPLPGCCISCLRWRPLNFGLESEHSIEKHGGGRDCGTHRPHSCKVVGHYGSLESTRSKFQT